MGSYSPIRDLHLKESIPVLIYVNQTSWWLSCPHSQEHIEADINVWSEIEHCTTWTAIQCDRTDTYQIDKKKLKILFTLSPIHIEFRTVSDHRVECQSQASYEVNPNCVKST